MSKAILMMDMPAACLTCKGLGRLKGGFLVPDKWYCRFDCMAREIDDNSSYMKFGRPDWCSLIPEPEKHTTYDSKHEHSADYYLGWNACIDTLEGNNKDGNK